MADTFLQMHAHLVFATKYRDASIQKSWSDSLEKYITGIVQNHGHKLLAIKAVSDHIHIFIGYNVNHLIPNLIEDIKTSSNKWIKEQKLCKANFAWQKGYGGFSHSHSQVEIVSNYIMNQENHHKKRTFREEYIQMLKDNGIDFKEEYLFEFFD
ncbi:MAG: hypothetical protein RIS29_1647 [Bacteroidota bacterium]|jgi:REP element-mobilizing transposase RayT